MHVRRIFVSSNLFIKSTTPNIITIVLHVPDDIKEEEYKSSEWSH